MAGKDEGGDFGFQIAPMVDVVFVLLLFFMACAGLTVKERFLSLGLPGDGEDPPIHVPIFVDIDSNGNVSVNGKIKSGNPRDRELAQVREHLTKSMEETPDNPVIVRTSLDARHERVVDVLQACRSSRVKKLSFG